MNQLDQLKQWTKVVADTGDFQSMDEYKPQDATTNPSLILAASNDAKYRYLIDQAVSDTKDSGLSGAALVEATIDRVLILFGNEILKIVPGRVSTEVDARLSFDRDATVDKARELIRIYEETGTDRGRVLIKIASTWEGIKAAEILQKENINCNLTLMFSGSSGCLCPSGHQIGLAIRWSNLRLVQSQEQHRIHWSRRSRCSVGYRDLSLLQKVRS